MSAALPANYRPPVPYRGRTLRTCKGLHIGGAYVADMPRPSADAEQLQAALLEPRTAHPAPALNRIASAVWAWC